MFADPEIGLINLNCKEVLHEYHITGKSGAAEEISMCNLSWGSRLVQTQEAKFFIMAYRLLMPYSLLSFVQ